MPLEEVNIVSGQVVSGKVQGVTNFGAFIELGGGTVGLVHISEIADTYVKDVKDYIKEGDEVKVKVLAIDGKKIGLSIKQAIEKPKPEPPRRRPEPSQSREPFYKKAEPMAVTLDDKIAKFLKESDEKMQTLKAKSEHKKRGRSS